MDFSHEEDGNGWLEKNARVFQEAQGKIATSMTPRYEAQPSGCGDFLIYLHKVSKAVVTANTPYPHESQTNTFTDNRCIILKETQVLPQCANSSDNHPSPLKEWPEVGEETKDLQGASAILLCLCPYSCSCASLPLA